MSAAAASGSLRRRLAVALVGLTVAAAAVQGFSYWAAERWVERSSLQDLLERELAHRIDTGAAASAAPADDAALHYYRPGSRAATPSALARLAPGWYERVTTDGRDYRALVRDAAPDDRVYLLYDISPLESRERQLLLLFGLGTIAVGALALWISRRLAARALAPLDALVAEIRALNPEARGVRLHVAGDPELQIIAEALDGYMQRLDALIERERAFAAAASHELRTPLAVIAGAAELLAAKPPDGARPLARIERAVAQARMDLDALLALSRRDEPAAAMLALDQLLVEWAEPHAAAQPAAVLEWQLAPVALAAPPGSLHIVFTNLLRNALRAAGAGGRVTVRLEPGCLRVLDDGPGIPADELPHVFEPHFRGRDGGTGIGLYVAKALAQRHGWRLGLVNRDSRGACAELRWA